MKTRSTVRSVVEDVRATSPTVISAICEEGVRPDFIAEAIKREVEAAPEALPCRIHVLDGDARGAIRACLDAPEAVHILPVRSRLPTEAWRDLASGRSRLARVQGVVLVQTVASSEDMAREASDVASFVAGTTHHIAASRRVVAYPMTPAEGDSARDAFALDSLVELGGGGVLGGEADDEAIEVLRSRGVVVDVFDARVTEACVEGDTDDPWPKTFELDVDLLAAMSLQQRLPEGLEVLERVGPERLKVRVMTRAALDAALSHGVRRARCVSTRRSTFESLVSPTRSLPRVRWNVYLHRREDLGGVRGRLEDMGATVLAAAGRGLRVITSEQVAEEARGWREVSRFERHVRPELASDVCRMQIGLCPHAGEVFPRACPWDGSGQVVGVADSGIDLEHPDLEDVVAEVVALGRPGDASDAHGHGTHVAGLIAGRGRRSPGLAGVAPGARLFVQCVVDAKGGLDGLPPDLAELFEAAYQRGVRVHNNSWGAWVDGRYEAQAEQVDTFVSERRDMLVVIAAGNRGTASKPSNGDPNAGPGFVEFGSVDAPAVAKNALTVGACRSERKEGGRSERVWRDYWRDRFADDPIGSERISGAPESMAAFSSRGPADESRVKPDLVAPGTSIASTWPRGLKNGRDWGVVPRTEGLYRYLGGTSMAAPIVAGCAARVRQFYVDARAHSSPSAALLKATLINGARLLTGADSLALPLRSVGAADEEAVPNFHQGFGCVDMAHTIPAPEATFRLAFEDPTPGDPLAFDDVGERRFSFELTERAELRCCVVWTDPPARGCQNLLQLTLVLPDQTRRLGNERRPWKSPFRSHDEANNVLSVRVPGAAPGIYQLSVRAVSLLRKPQEFACVVTGPLAEERLRRDAL